MSDRQPALVVEQMYKSFGMLEVLKGVSMTAAQGDVIALIGASGSGKSTFLRCINLLEIPNSGRVWVGGELLDVQRDRRGRPVYDRLANELDRRRSETAVSLAKGRRRCRRYKRGSRR